jgi:hypothetical protein
MEKLVSSFDMKTEGKIKLERPKYRYDRIMVIPRKEDGGVCSGYIWLRISTNPGQ